jgi:hypothetical protein
VVQLAGKLYKMAVSVIEGDPVVALRKYGNSSIRR